MGDRTEYKADAFQVVPGINARIAIAGALCCVLGPIGLAYGMLLHFASDVPILDDYHAIFGFCLGWERLPTLESKIAYLVSYQHVDYKLVFQEVILAAELALTHHISIRFLIVLGDLFLLPILFLLWKLYPAKGLTRSERAIRFLPVVAIFFGLNYSETLDFAMGGLQILPSILFSMVAIYLLVGAMEDASPGTFLVACLAAIVACLSSASGFLLIPIGVAALIVRRAYWKSMLWCAAFALPGFVYRYHYTPFPHPPEVAFSLKPIFFLSLLGDGAPAYKLIIPAGVLIVTVYLLAVSVRYDRQSLAAFLWATWLMLNAALVTVGRARYGFDWSYTSRYRIYSDFLFIFCYQFALDRFAKAPFFERRKRLIYLGALFASLVLCLRADMIGLEFLEGRRQKLQIGLEQYRAAPNLKSPMYLANPGHDGGAQEEARILTNEAVAAGIYRLPAPGDP